MSEIRLSLAALDRWIERNEFKGWDPHDGLNSPLVKRLTFGSHLLGIVALQLIKRSPINLRPLLGVKKGYNPKGMGLFLASYLRKSDATRSRFFLDWLEANATPGYHGACWGDNFDWPNRNFFAPAGTPTIVNTAFIGLACLDAGDRGVALARSACEFILRDLKRHRANEHEHCFSYTPIDNRQVHNANVVGAWLLAETSKITGDSELAAAALSAARFTARRQRDDGTWPYGEGRRDAWVDNFHTAYVLVALRRIGRAVDTSEFDEGIRRGYDYWTRMFDEDGAPHYFSNRKWPVDAHCAAQAILTFIEFGDLANARKVAKWTIENMQDRQGYFHYQVHRFHRIRIPYMRWCQAWMQRALTELAAHD